MKINKNKISILSLKKKFFSHRVQARILERDRLRGDGVRRPIPLHQHDRLHERHRRYHRGHHDGPSLRGTFIEQGPPERNN